MEEIEDASINFLKLAQSIQATTDYRLKEDFISRIPVEERHAHEGLCWAEQFNKTQCVKINEDLHSGILTYGQTAMHIEKEMIANHSLQYMIEPILLCEERFKFYTKRRNLTRLEVLQNIRGRIGFFAISNLFDQVEMKDKESKIIQNIQ